jgi:hypothetical protein
MSLPAEWLQFAPKPRPLVPPDKWNVFLSYRSVNRAWVLNLYDVLKQQGNTVFIDQCELKPGDELQTRLEEALRTSQAGVLIWSAATRDSDWVRREHQVLERQATRKKDFQFVPVTLDKAEIPDFIQNRIYLDFSSYPDGPNGGELLRLLYALAGQPLDAEAAYFALQQDEAAKDAAAKIAAAVMNKDPERIMELFEQGGVVWETSSSLGCQAVEGLTKLGRESQALDLLGSLQLRFPRAIRPKQLQALALARRGGQGDLRRAQEIVGELYHENERDPETLGIYARTWMDRYHASGDVSDLQQSRDLYAEAFQRAPDDYYTGINAAAKSVFLGTAEDLAKAAEYAGSVQAIVGTEAKPGDYWMTATVAELFLIKRMYAEAARIYEAAVASARAEVGSHRSTWKQACRLLAKLEPSAGERAAIRKAFAHLPDCDQL